VTEKGNSIYEIGKNDKTEFLQNSLFDLSPQL